MQTEAFIHCPARPDRVAARRFRGQATAAAVLALGLLLAQPGRAVEPPRPAGNTDSADALARQLRAQYPGTRIDGVRPAIVPGLFEVAMGRNVAYVEPGGRYFVFGHVWDMQQQRDLTAERLGAGEPGDLSKLPSGMALTSVRGSGQRVLHVFADPQCGHCRQLERTLDQLDDVTLHTYPLPLLGEASRRIAEGIWCSGRREQAWRDWMHHGVQPPVSPAGCDTEGLARIERAARSLGVQATPMLIRGDGRRRAGALPASELVAWLEALPNAPVSPSVVVPPAANARTTVASPPTKVNP